MAVFDRLQNMLCALSTQIVLVAKRDQISHVPHKNPNSLVPSSVSPLSCLSYFFDLKLSSFLNQLE